MFKVNQPLNHNGKMYLRGDTIKDMSAADIHAFTEAGYGQEVKEDKKKDEPENKAKSPPATK